MPSSSEAGESSADPLAALKRAAAEQALRYLTPGRIVGVGSGSTVAHFVAVLARQRDRFARAVSSSDRTSALLEAAGIEVLDLNDAGPIDVYVDGADEVDPGLALVKGGGGALTREKILAEASREFVCIVDHRKEVARLGRFPVPVEVIPMARGLVTRQLEALGATVRLRPDFVTDNGHVILDAAGLVIDDPASLECRINQWPGVVTVGIFARRRADVLLVARPDGVSERRAPRFAQDAGGTYPTG